MLLLIQYTILFASILILVALGGCFAEHSVMITSCPLFARKLDRNGKSEA